MSEKLNDKLRSLRREPARKPLEQKSVRPELPVWLRAKLKGRDPEEPTTLGSLDPPREIEVDAAGWAARTRGFALGHRHGDWSLSEVLDESADRAAPERLTGDTALADFDLENAVYLDIEATGLSGGAGTIPFMVALGRFTNGSFELWQGFLRGPEEEAALLAEVARRVRASAGVVSFFGKSYDRHRLEDKMCLHGIEPPFADTPHLDLYHPLARLVKGSLPDTKLQRLEHELCRVTRADDLPGSFAPTAWFDFLRDRPHRLEDVFRHNEDDVLSLVVLAAYLVRVEAETRVDGRALLGCASTRAHALSRWFAAQRDQTRALTWAFEADRRERSAAGQMLVGELHRRAGEFAKALAVWDHVAESGTKLQRLSALVETAKVAEHRTHNLELALAAVDRAFAVLDTNGAIRAGATGIGYQDLKRRKERLDAKSSGTRANQ